MTISSTHPDSGSPVSPGSSIQIVNTSPYILQILLRRDGWDDEPVYSGGAFEVGYLGTRSVSGSTETITFRKDDGWVDSPFQIVIELTSSTVTLNYVVYGVSDYPALMGVGGMWGKKIYLNTLLDVDAPDPDDSEVLAFDAATQTWVPRAASTPGSHALDSHSDVSVAAATEDQVLTLQGGIWVGADPASGGVTDHGALTGLTPDDDHPQYHTDARGDARYSQLGHPHSNFSSGSAGFTPASGGGTTNYLRADGSWQPPPGGGSTTFIALTDTDPTTYSGQSGKLVRVNTGETGLEFVDPAGGTKETLQQVLASAPIDNTVTVPNAAPIILEDGSVATTPLILSKSETAGTVPALGVSVATNGNDAISVSGPTAYLTISPQSILGGAGDNLVVGGESSSAPGDVFLTGAASTGAATGGDISVAAGASTSGTGGTLRLDAGDGTTPGAVIIGSATIGEIAFNQGVSVGPTTDHPMPALVGRNQIWVKASDNHLIFTPGVMADIDLSVGGTGVDTFEELTDTATYVGHANEYVRVNPTATGLVYGTPAGGVDTANSPLANEFARFTDPDTIEGRTYAEVRSDLGLVIGTNVQAYSSVLQNTTASFLTAQESKLGNITVTQAVNLDTMESTLATAILDADFTAAEGFMQKLSTGTYRALKSNLIAITDPDPLLDNATAGYGVGSRWINQADDKEFVCTDPSNTLAVWKDTTSGGTGGVVDEVIAGTGITVDASVPASPVVTFGPLSLTQLNAAIAGDDVLAADFANYTTKATPVSADTILINDSAAAGAVKKVTVSSLGGGAEVNNLATMSGVAIDQVPVGTGAGTGAYKALPNGVVKYDTTGHAFSAATIGDLNVVNDDRILGRISGPNGGIEELTAAQATSLLDTFSTTTTTKGVVPGGNNLGSTYSLRADGTWSAAGGGGDVLGEGGTLLVGELPAYSNVDGKRIARSALLVGTASAATGTRTITNNPAIFGGHITTGGTIAGSANGAVALGAVTQTSGTASLTGGGIGSATFGNVSSTTGTASISNTSNGAIQCVNAVQTAAGTASTAQSSCPGSLLVGQVQSGGTLIGISAAGAWIGGDVSTSGSIGPTSSSPGSMSHGYCTGASSNIYAQGQGARALGRATSAGVLSATANAATAIGNATTNAITASGLASFALGDSTSGAITASATNSLQLGPGTNAEALSMAVGTMGSGGIRLIGDGAAAASPQNGDVHVASGVVTVRSNGANVPIKARPMSVTVETPVSGNVILMGRSDRTLTIANVHGVIDSGTSVVVSLDSGASRATSDQQHVNAQTVSSTTTGNDLTKTANLTFDSGDWIWVTIGTVTGTVGSICLTVSFT